MSTLADVIRKKWEQLSPAMSERQRRLWAGTEADAIGHGGVKLVAAATGLAISTIGKGKKEARNDAGALPVGRDRRPGAGRKRLESKAPSLRPALEALVAPATRGDPEAPLLWSSKSTRKLAAELAKSGHRVSPSKVGSLLKEAGFSLQANSRVKEGKEHPDRDEQFEFINARTKEFLARELPVISVDTKKKEAVGEHGNVGKEWRPKGKPIEVLTYDYVDPTTPKAVPYGVYDVGNNKGFVNVGTDHDTPVFAVHSIERWWERMGSQRYPNAKELFVTADCGGSNSRKSHAWKAQLQALADRHGLTIHVSHYPPGTSKWNRIEHRLFSFITMNWRGKPLLSYETVVSLIAGTTTRKGLTVTAELDRAKYPLGIRVSREETRALNLERDAFHGEWNYVLRPRTPEQIAAAKAALRPARKKITHASLRARWSALFREQRASGLSHTEFCRARGLNYGVYKSAHRRIIGLIRPKKQAKE